MVVMVRFVWPPAFVDVLITSLSLPPEVVEPLPYRMTAPTV